jgi:hypothetical protein
MISGTTIEEHINSNIGVKYDSANSWNTVSCVDFSDVIDLKIGAKRSRIFEQ